MPAFVANGPDIPESLLQVHEEGRVVFFCGAGISYPAGLPGFGGLVKAIYSELGVCLTLSSKRQLYIPYTVFNNREKLFKSFQ